MGPHCVAWPHTPAHPLQNIPKIIRFGDFNIIKWGTWSDFVTLVSVVLHYVLARLPRMQRGAWPQNRGAWPGLGRGLAGGLAGLGRGLDRAWRGLVQALNEDFLNPGRGFALDFRLRRPGCLF